MKKLNKMIKGVNLGNWLVLEKWMNPALFQGTTAEDEFNLPLQLPKEVYEARIRIHRSEYITERDFVQMKSLGRILSSGIVRRSLAASRSWTRPLAGRSGTICRF